METDFTKALADFVWDQYGLSQSNVEVSYEQGMAFVRINGQLRGDSLIYAAKRRRTIRNRVRRMAAEREIDSYLTFGVKDALTRVEAAVKSIADVVLPDQDSMVSGDVTNMRDAVFVITANRYEDRSAATIRQLVKRLLKDHKIGDVEILLSADREDITDMRILRLLKTCAPCDAEVLAKVIEREEGIEVARQVVQSRLDRIRQKGLLVHVGGGQVSLAMAALQWVPVSKNRNSSDIDRVLALGRKEW